jgi:hypothetical protein
VLRPRTLFKATGVFVLQHQEDAVTDGVVRTRLPLLLVGGAGHHYLLPRIPAVGRLNGAGAALLVACSGCIRFWRWFICLSLYNAGLFGRMCVGWFIRSGSGMVCALPTRPAFTPRTLPHTHLVAPRLFYRSLTSIL